MTWRPSIRLFVPLVLVTPILAVTAALVVLSSITGQRVAEDLAEQWGTGAASHVEREVRDFLATAVRTSDRYVRRIERGSLPADDPWSWHDRLLDDLTTSPELGAIAFVNPEGDAAWIVRRREGFALGSTDGDAGEAHEVRLDPQRPEAPEPLRAWHEDPRTRPWYEAAHASAEPLWMPITSAAGDGGEAAPFPAGELHLGYARAVRSSQGAPLGVLAVEVATRGLSDFLRRSPVARQGYLFVLDDTGHLVAVSDGPVTSPQGDRLMPMQSSSMAARSLVLLLGQPRRPGDVYRVHFEDGTPARVDVTPLKPYPGVDWRIVSVVPESVFLEDVRASQSRATMIGLVAAIGAVVLGLILARHIVDPILRLRAHTRRIGGGQLDARVNLHSARELEELATDLNRMTAGLQEAMAVKQALTVADEVQRSLLPLASPRVPGLDIVGLAHYCDATGGDYFDFIELPGTSPRRVLVAVGDVMGHGVAAALLMATARGALRAAAAAGGSLGELITRVNDVLARDARHGRFMTLVLAIVEPETATLRWASAGHDAPLVLDPAPRDQTPLAPLEGGDLPLGVQERLTYEEYTCRLPRHAVIVLGTDGTWEARDPAGRMYGRRRLRELLQGVAGLEAQDIADALRADLRSFLGTARMRDDAAFVVMRLRE